MNYLKLLFLLPVLASAQVSAQVTIRGHVQHIDGPTTITIQDSKRQVLAETTVDTNQNYTLSVPVAEAQLVSVQCGQYQAVSMWLQDENVEIDFHGSDTAMSVRQNPPFVYIRNAGPNNELMNLVNYNAYSNRQTIIGINQAVYQSAGDDMQAKNSMARSLISKVTEGEAGYFKYLIEHYADRPAVMALISRLGYDANRELIERALTSLAENSPSSRNLVDTYRKQQEERISAVERMKEGQPAPTLSYQDAKGKQHTLSELKGKIVVLDFWASWCRPCRAEIPNLKNYYAGFDHKKVEFLSVSIDAKHDDWTKALAEEGCTWPQGWVADSKTVTQTYQFNAIPFILVIDKDGRIYKKNVRGEDIRSTVEELMKK